MQVLSKIQIDEFIEFERYRDLLAKNNNDKEFFASYDKKYPRIPNKNTGSKWDKLNSEFVYNKKVFPMAWHRIITVSKWLAKTESNNIQKVLNIGFGSGNLEKYISNNLEKYDWQGIDISNKSVSKATKTFPKCRFILGDFMHNNFGTNNYDVIISLEVLEHISPENTFKFLGKVYSLLKKNGVFILSVPLNEGLQKMLENGSNPNAHVRVYTPNIIKKELLLASFSIINQKYLFAFNSGFRIKSLIANLFKTHTPNQILLMCKKS